MARAFSLSKRVEFAETDLAGVMLFANYFRCMEEIEHAFLRSIELNVISEHEGGQVSFPRKTVSCEYSAPVHFQDEVELSLRVTRIGEKSLEYEVEFGHEGRRVALGRQIVVCCRMQGGEFEAISIPDFIRARLQAYTVKD